MSSRLYIPGRGMVDLEAHRVDTAVREYDERLFFDEHPVNGQWCIFIKVGAELPYYPDMLYMEGTNVIPILGFDKIPHPEDALKRLYAADTVRHGEQILDDMNRRNEAAKKAAAKQADEATGEAAEAMEWFNRQVDKHPVPRIFVPGGKE